MDQIKEKLISIVRDLIPIDVTSDERNYDKPLREMGIDSLDMMLVFLNVQEKFGLDEIPDDEIKTLRTINQTAQYIANELEKKRPQ
jgi:acyl carrier protein